MTQTYNQAASLLITEFKSLPSWQHKYRHLMKIGSKLTEFPSRQKLDSNKVSGCESNVWLIKSTLSANEGESEGGDNSGSNPHTNAYFNATSDARIMTGLLYVLLCAINHGSDEYINQFKLTDYLNELGLAHHLSESRGNGLNLIFSQIKEML